MTPEELQKKQQEELQKEFEDVLFKSERKFSDKILLYYAEGYFAMRIYSGNDYQTFVLTPHQVKKLGLWIGAQIERYEGAFGEIKLPQAQPMLSPIQLEDDQKPPEDKPKK